MYTKCTKYDINKKEELKSKQKCNYDKYHVVRELPSLNQGDTVWIPNQDIEAVVEEVAPRSYEVSTPNGTYIITVDT